MRTSVAEAGQIRAGFLYGLVAYSWWGLVPLYFRQVKEVPAAEILAHRICWSVILMMGVTAVMGTWADLGRVFASRKLLLTLLLSAVLLAINWLLYIYATVTGRVAEASLGYYMMPLVNAFLGTVFLKEKLRPAHYPALALVAIGVMIPFLWEGEFTWLAVALPITFGFYGLVRKKVSVDSATGLTMEALLLLVPSLGFLLWQGHHGVGKFGQGNLDGLLMFSGIVTVVPLLTYTLSIRRLPLIAVSFIQFLSPTIQMLIAVYYFEEVVSKGTWAAIVCIWVAVGIFLVDAAIQLHGSTRRVKTQSLPALTVSTR